MSLDIRREIIADEIVISLIGDTVAEGGETICLAESIVADGFEDILEVRVEGAGGVVVRVAEVFNVFAESAKEEDVGVANFACDFDLWRGH